MSEVTQSDVYKAYIAHRELLCKQEFETSRDCDKWTLTAAGTALALSFTFLKDVVNLSAAHHKWLLLPGWGTLVGAVAASLISLHLGELAHRRFQECLDEAGKAGFDDKFWSRVRCEQAKCWHDPWTSRFSRLALALTLAGLVSLLLFVYVNIQSAGESNVQATPQAAATAPSASASATPTSATATATAGGVTATATTAPAK